jgi:glycosyltransferase involved in cell wall biosynthesis
MSKDILVVIPAYNEEIAIGSLVLRARKYASRVAVVDDWSGDLTEETARLAGAEIIRHQANQGKGRSVRDAFGYARASGADVLVLMDGDGQHAPEDIPALVKPILSREADMVNGSKFVAGVKKASDIPIYRRFGQEVLTLCTNVGMGQRITDTQNGFRAFSRDTFDCFSFGQGGMAIESEMLMDAVRNGLRIKEVPINVRYDVQGSTYNPFVHGLSVLIAVLGLIVRKRNGLETREVKNPIGVSDE